MVAPLGAHSCGGCSRRFLCCLRRSTCSPGAGWRLILFGAKIGKRVLIRPGVRVTYPWNLTMGDYVWIGDNVHSLFRCGNIDRIAFLCFTGIIPLCGNTRLPRRYVCICQHSDKNWGRVLGCCAVFIGPGVEVGHAAVVGAGSVVMTSVDAETIVAGNPAKFVGKRTLEMRADRP